MMWLIFGGIAVIVFVVALGAWAVVALLAEVGDEQDAATDEPQPDTTPARVRVHSRATRF